MKKTIQLVFVLTVALFSGLAVTSNAQILTNEYVGYTGAVTWPIPANGWSSYAKLTNNGALLWNQMPAGATNGVITDISGQTNVLIRMVIQRKADFMIWQGTNTPLTIAKSPTTATNYFQMTGYVVSNSVPQGTQFKWRAVWY